MGAEAFALPTKLGQAMTVSEFTVGTLDWKAKNHKGELWFEAEFDQETLAVRSSSEPASAQVLRGILSKARDLNPEFLKEGTGYRVETHLQFPNDWGLGSSSTLICNVAKWSETNAFDLSEASFGGSGVDIAIGMVGSELLYSRPPAWDSFVFQPPFKENLYFIHLGIKQNSRDAIALFDQSKVQESDIKRISEISRALVSTSKAEDFQALITEHEEILAHILGRQTVKEVRFMEYPYAIKSLGAWGGDFILAYAEDGSEQYFRDLGYETVLPFQQIIK